MLNRFRAMRRTRRAARKDKGEMEVGIVQMGTMQERVTPVALLKGS
jgi:hypothetical protein